MIALYQPLAVTTHYFLQAVLTGLCLGIVYDVLAGIRMVCQGHRWTEYMLDGIFWAIALVVYFVYTVTLAAGQVRGFLVVGMGSGVVFCHLAAGWIVRRMVCTTFQFLRWTVNGIIWNMKIILRFIHIVWKWIQKNLKKIFKKTSISGKKTL